jgi:hypothetical protein
MWFVSQDRGSELIAKTRSLGAAGLGETKDILAQFYGILSILDTKATGLLTVNTLFGAILLALIADHGTLIGSLHLAVDTTFIAGQLLATGLSSVLCLLIIRVTWQFLESVPRAPKQPEDFEAEVKRLATVIDDRTHFYWIAWWLAVLAFMAAVAWWSPIAAGSLIVIVVGWLNTHG